MQQHEIAQRAEHGNEPEHMHESVVHTHDHYHVSHHHSGGLLSEWEHKTFWHTHAHNHNQITHGHDYGMDEEEQQHGKQAHVHDHSAPVSASR